MLIQEISSAGQLMSLLTEAHVQYMPDPEVHLACCLIPIAFNAAHLAT